MKKVVLLTEKSRKKEMLISLRKQGVMHISDKVTSSKDATLIHKNIEEMEKVLFALEERKDKKAAAIEKSENFKELHSHIVSLLEEKETLSSSIISLRSEAERVYPYGDFDPEELRSLSEYGYSIKIYSIENKEKDKLREIEDIVFVTLSVKSKIGAIALINSQMPDEITASEFNLPSLSLSKINEEIETKMKRAEDIEAELVKLSAMVPVYKNEIEKEEDVLSFEVASATVTGEDVIYLTGYVPESEEQKFISYAEEENLAYMIDDPKDDDNPPTRIKYKGLFRIIDPVFKVLGTVPGYRETDVSQYFLIFFTIFFAMIVGDGGYGLIFLLLGVLLNLKAKKLTDVNILLYVLGGATVVWGAITGTWFGSSLFLEKLPFLKIFVIPRITNFPELSNVSSTYSQNGQMKLCFTLGVIQLVLARVINIVNKIKKRDLSLLADFGWLLDSAVLYFLALSLVIGESVSVKAVAIAVAVGFLLVCIFGAQGPGIPFSKGLKSGLAGFFTTFLDTISCFSNLMSYIRLFAVGMASFAIAESFNSMGGGIIGGLLTLFGVIIIVLGHLLNIVMAILSVLVHDVRLNLLEFSGSVGIEWSGYNFEPFMVRAKENIND